MARSLANLGGFLVLGGQLTLVRFHPAELPGVAAGTGPEIAAVCAAQLAAAGVFAECGREVAGLEAAGACVRMRLTSGDRIEARALLIATGLRRRRLRVPGEAELADRGVSYSARRDREAFAGREVVVVGGGDGAFENALMLAAVGCRVLLLIRGRARARPSFEARVAAEPAIVVR